MDFPHDPASEREDGLIPFEPARTPHPRRNGWTAERQKAFIRVLAETGNATHAARTVGLSRESAYHLAAKPQARAFARAWDEALLVAHRRLVGLGIERVIEGTVETIWKDGECVGERRRPSERLHIFLLKHLDPRRADLPRSDGDMEDEPLGLPASEVSLLMLDFEDEEDNYEDPSPGASGAHPPSIPRAHPREA